MKNKYKVITIRISLLVIIVLSLVALFIFPYKILFSVLLIISVPILIVYYIFSGNEKVSQETESEDYSGGVLIVEELERFFVKEKPYLNPDFKIADLEKQLKVSHKEITEFTRKRFRRNFEQFLNLWRIAELRRLQSLIENMDVSVNKLCLKAGFRNALQYHKAEKERIAINKKRNSKKRTVNNYDDDDVVINLCAKKKPETQMRV